MNWLLYAVGPVIGFLGMLSGGFWGVGCGWIVVPTMLILGFDPLSAVGIGLLQMVPSTVLTVRRQAPEIGWGPGSYGRSLALPIALGAFVTSFVGRPVNDWLAARLGSAPLQWLLLGVIVFIAVQTLLSRTPEDCGCPAIPRSRSVIALGAGLVTGVLSSLLGIGGGLLIRPLLSSGFRVPEYYTGRIVRLLVLVTTVTGGATYLVRAGSFDWQVCGVSLLVAAGGVFGFPLGAHLHELALKAGFANWIHKSFAVVALALLLNTLLNLAGRQAASRVAMLVIALGLSVYLLVLGRVSRRRLAAEAFRRTEKPKCPRQAPSP